MAKSKAEIYTTLVIKKGKAVRWVANKYGVSYQTVHDTVRRTTDPKYAARRRAQQAACNAGRAA